MNKTTVEKREGFWKSALEPELPTPKACQRPHKDQAVFLEALSSVEFVAHESAYRGWSVCRVCRKPNGNEEFKLVGWVWPQGYRHYIEEHNVRPSPEFKQFVMERAE